MRLREGAEPARQQLGNPGLVDHKQDVDTCAPRNAEEVRDTCRTATNWWQWPTSARRGRPMKMEWARNQKARGSDASILSVTPARLAPVASA